MASIKHIAAVINVHSEIQTAARRAAELASSLDARLSLFAVVHQSEAAFDLFHILDQEHVRHQFVAEAQDRLHGLVGQLGLDPANVQTLVHWQHPFNAGVLHVLKQLNPDVLVVAARDEKCQRLSHAEWRLLQTAGVPLLVARPQAWNDPPIMMACVDPGHHGDEDASVDRKILDFALTLHPRAAQLELLHAYGEIPDAISVAQSPSEYRDQLRASRERKIRSWLPESLRDILPLHLIEKGPREAITQFVESRPAALVVMGVFSRSSLSDFLIGSTARRILPRLPCDIMVIPADM